MGQISAGNKTLLRQPVDTHRSLERLYLFGFPTLWTGRVNEAPARGDRSITYDGGAMAAGFAFADLTTFGAGLEVWFGSAAGLKDRGVRRLRSMGIAEAAGTMVIDWYDNNDFADDDFITIKHFYPPWPKFSWFTSVGPAFRKDGPDGTLYAASGDANDTPAPHVIMGRNYAGEMPAAGTLTIQCNATNSVDVAGGGGAVTYAWDVTPPGGAAFNNTAIGAPTLTLTTTGKWWIHCTVTTDGRSATAHRAVVVGGGITEFSRSPITTQYDRTDIECQIILTSPETGTDIRGVMTWADFQDHGLVIIAAQDTYGATAGSIGFHNEAVYTDREHIVFCGYITLENDDLVEDGTGAVQFTAVSAMDMFLYSLSLTGVTAASQWYEMNRTLMTIAGNLLHLFRWHSTLLDIADWWLPWTDTVRRSANEEFGEGDIFERARALCRARLMGMTGNPQGEIFVETDLNLRSAADRAAATTTLTLTEADVAGTKRVRMRRRGDLVRVLADGGYSSGIMNSFQPFFSASANVAVATARPALMHPDRLMAPAQTEMNRIAARLAAVQNRQYVEVNLDFAGNYRDVFGPDSQQWTDLGNLFAGSLQANIRGDTGLVDALAVPRQVSHSHDNATGQTTVSVIFEPEAPVELDGRTITPPSVPSEDPGDGTWDMPGPPAYPALPEIALSGSIKEGDFVNGVYVLLPGLTDWVERNGGLASTAVTQTCWDPWWFTPSKKNSHDPNQAILWICEQGFIGRSTDCGVTWLDVTPGEDPPNAWLDAVAPTVSDLTFVQRTDNIHANKEHYFLAEWQEAGGAWRGWLLKTDDDGAEGSWTWMALGGAGNNTFTFDYGAEDWVAVATATAGGPWEGSWDSVVGHNLSGSLRVNMGPKTAFANLEGQWRYYPSATLIVATGDTVDGWAYGAGNFCHGNGIVLMYTDGTFDYTEEVNYVDWRHITTTVTAPNNGKTLHFVGLDSHTGPGCGPPQGLITAWWDDITFGFNAINARPIWMDCDSEDGSRLWLTVWHGDNVLYLENRNTSDLVLETYDSLGACTIAQLFGTYVAYPHTPTFNKDYCYIFGRMQNPQGLGNPAHLIKTQNGGAAFTAVLTSLGADILGAFRAEGTTDGGRTFYGIRNSAGAVPKLWRGLETLAYISDLPFGAGAFVAVDALTINSAQGKVAAGSDTAAATMIVESVDNGATWNDITGSLPVNGSIRSLTYF